VGSKYFSEPCHEQKGENMAEPCVGCGKTEIHPFEGLVRSIMDGGLYYVYCKPPLQDLHGECRTCEWQIIHRVIPKYCPYCGKPTRVFTAEKTSKQSCLHLPSA
jgi:hypothetical protein